MSVPSDVMAQLADVVRTTDTGVAAATRRPPDSLDDARELISQLETAVEHRTVIGQATGVVMERFGLDAAGAFAVLRTLSQEQNRKIYDLARELVASGHSAGL